MKKVTFEWDLEKDLINQEKHEISFSYAQKAFRDPKRRILEDVKHSDKEKRYYCFGLIEDEVVTVRYTYRNNVIRIIGAGYWRKGRKHYEEKNSLHR